MACTKPDTKFEQFTTMLASDVSRRDAFKFVGAAALAAMLTSVGIKQAEAANGCKGLGGVCDGNVSNCDGCTGFFGCYCFDVTGSSSKRFCGQNAYCSQIPTCLTNADCGKKHKCTYDNGCTGCPGTSGVCLVKCKTGKCPPPPQVSGSGGKTAVARR